MLSIGITTAPRGIVYIGQSLASYFDEWSITPHVFAEPKSPYYINRSRIVEHRAPDDEKPEGCIGNWWQTAQWLLNNTTTPFIMTCEDDIAWSKGSGEKVRKLLNVLVSDTFAELPREKIGFISPYCSKVNAPKEYGWRPPRYLKSGWCGALCLIFPRTSLEKILNAKADFLEYAYDTKYPERGPVHLDYPIGKLLLNYELSLITHSPTLITHLGDCSTFPKHNEPRAMSHESRMPNL